MARNLQVVAERLYGETYGSSFSDRNDPDTYEGRVRSLIEDARWFNNDTRAPKREMMMRFYEGIEPFLDEEGRSTIVATEVRDTILAIMPSLMRIFTAREHVVEYIPNYEAMVPFAEQATDYVSTVFMEDNDGFLILHSVFKDALTKAEGIVKWWTDSKTFIKEFEYKNCTPEQFQYVISQPGAEVLSHEVHPPQPPFEVPTADVRVRFTRTEI
jgi:hypothetical protein